MPLFDPGDNVGAACHAWPAAGSPASGAGHQEGLLEKCIGEQSTPRRCLRMGTVQCYLLG